MVHITTTEHTVFEQLPHHSSGREPEPKRLPWRIIINVLFLYLIFLIMMISITISNKSP